MVGRTTPIRVGSDPFATDFLCSAAIKFLGYRSLTTPMPVRLWAMEDVVVLIDRREAMRAGTLRLG